MVKVEEIDTIPFSYQDIVTHDSESDESDLIYLSLEKIFPPGFNFLDVLSTSTWHMGYGLQYNHTPVFCEWLRDYEAGRAVPPGKLVVDHMALTIDFQVERTYNGHGYQPGAFKGRKDIVL